MNALTGFVESNSFQVRATTRASSTRSSRSDRPSSTTASVVVAVVTVCRPARTVCQCPRGASAAVISSSSAPISARRRSPCPYPTTSVMPCIESVTCWPSRPRSAAPRPAATTLRRAPSSGRPTAETSRPTASTIATGHEIQPPMPATAIVGTVTAVIAGGKVCAKNTSTRSMSFVARTSRSPEVDRWLTIGACGTSAR